MPSQENYIGQELRRARESLNPKPTQKVVAEQVGRSTIWYKRIESGSLRPTIDKLNEIVTVLGIDPEITDSMAETIRSKRDRNRTPSEDETVTALYVTSQGTRLPFRTGQQITFNEFADALNSL